MPTISDPADGQFQAPIRDADAKRAARVNALVALYTRDHWRDASAMKTGEPALLCDEIVRLRELVEFGARLFDRLAETCVEANGVRPADGAAALRGGRGER